MSYLRNALMRSAGAPITSFLSQAPDTGAGAVLAEEVARIAGLVATGDVNLNQFKAAFKTSQGRDTTLSDPSLIKMIAATEDTLDDAGWTSLMLALENPNAPQVLEDTSDPNDEKRLPPGASSIADRAYMLAKLADHDEELNALFAKQWASKQFGAVAAFETLLSLQRLYGDKLQTLPVVGYGDEKAQDYDGTNVTDVNRDIYYITAPKVDGGVKQVRRSFFNDFCDGFHYGETIAKEIEEWNKAKNEDMSGKHGRQAKNVIKRERKIWTGKQGTFRAQMKRAVTLGKQIAALSALPRVQLDKHVVKDATTSHWHVKADITEPFTLWGLKESEPGKLTLDSEQWDVFSVTKLLSLDIDAAIAKDGGTFASLCSTLGREGDPPTAKIPRLANIGMVEEAISELAAFVNLPDDKGVGAVTKMMANASNDLILSFGDWCMQSDAVWTAIKGKYEALKLAGKGDKRAGLAAAVVKGTKAA